MRAREPCACSAACPIGGRNVVYSLPLPSTTVQRVLPFRVSLVFTDAIATSASPLFSPAAMPPSASMASFLPASAPALNRDVSGRALLVAAADYLLHRF